MKIVMMGSGGVGGYFGARLATGGADVHFVARGAHLAAMRSQGLTIEGGPAPFHLANVQATDNPSSIGSAIDRPGVIRQTGPMQRLLFGELDGTITDRGKALLEAALKGGIAAQLS